jgi:hypothetical protein
MKVSNMIGQDLAVSPYLTSGFLINWSKDKTVSKVANLKKQLPAFVV